MDRIPAEIVAYLPFALAAFVVVVALVAYCLWPRPSVRTEGPPRTAEEQVGANDDTIKIPQSGTYDVVAAHDLTMRLTRPTRDREPTIPVNVAQPAPALPWEWAK